MDGSARDGRYLRSLAPGRQRRDRNGRLAFPWPSRGPLAVSPHRYVRPSPIRAEKDRAPSRAGTMPVWKGGQLTSVTRRSVLAAAPAAAAAPTVGGSAVSQTQAA